jgi:hypothetical protein
MWISKKKYRNLLDRVEQLEEAVLRLPKTGQEERQAVSEKAEEKKSFGEIKREWMLFEDERGGATA